MNDALNYRMGRTKPSAVTVDSAVQRSLNVARAQDMANRYDPASVGVITVSERDGNLYVVDGQHRCEAAKLAGQGDVALDSKIYKGLTRVDEAKLFIALNSARIPNAVARFKVRLEAQDPVPVAITKILKDYGWRVGGPGSNGAVNAVSALEAVYALDPDEERGVFDATFDLITRTWGFDAEGAAAPVLGGVGAFMDRYVDKADISAFAKKVRSTWGSAIALVGQGKNLRSSRGGKLTMCIGEILHMTYNAKRRTGVLDPW